MFSYTCFKRANPEHMHSRGETVGNSSSPSGFLYVTHILVLHFSTSCPPSCVCAGFVFMTTPVIRRYCRELLVLTQLRCITQTVVAASYLAPGSVLQSGVFFFCDYFRSRCRYVQALSLSYIYKWFEQGCVIVTMTSLKHKMSRQNSLHAPNCPP